MSTASNQQSATRGIPGAPVQEILGSHANDSSKAENAHCPAPKNDQSDQNERHPSPRVEGQPASQGPAQEALGPPTPLGAFVNPPTNGDAQLSAETGNLSEPGNRQVQQSPLPPRVGQPPVHGQPTNKAPAEGAPALQTPPNVPILAQARKCTFEQFVNRFSPEEAGYAIEYLEAGNELGMGMASEVTKRRLAKVKGYEDRNTSEYKSRRFDGGLSSGTWLQALRIQSQTVLNALAEVSGYNWGTEPHTFMRPFGHLIHFYPHIKDKLESLKAVTIADGEDTPHRDTIEHLECYIAFAEEHLLPLVDQFVDASYSNPKRIRYEDLWYLFKPGDLVYMPRRMVEKQLRNRGDNDPFPESAIHHTIFRLEVFMPHDSDLDLPMLGRASTDWVAEARLYFVDHDGSAYKPVQVKVTMDHFDGEKDIRSLDIFPIRFVPDSEALVENSRELGKKFIECVEQRHVSYKAWTLLSDPLGRRYGQQNTGRAATSPEFIDGDVVIDFQEAFNAHPTWKYSYGLPFEEWSSDVLTSPDKFPILLWSDASRSKLLFEWPHIVVSDDDIDFLEGKERGRKDPYGQNGLDKPPLEDLVLLPRRLCGYGLHERKFFFLDVKDVKVDREDIDAFRFLQIDPGNRHIIHCLLTDHFNTKQARKTREISSQDPIPGKGHNLVFLLHGPPGVGKTATVEAVAQKYRKPLFAITSGDLGSTPDAVESSLTEIFHLANVWDCILLLDEADVFLEEREKSDLKRNAVVSVFLRVMEYYNGILFLTTNRPGQLDEAIKSRVHSALLYQTLSLEQTLEIFRMNIERLELIEKQRGTVSDPPQAYLQADKRGILAFAEKHWRLHEFDELGRWNGRQIRNAFISAAALARGDIEDGERNGMAAVTVLTERHFEAVASSVTAFDKYMARARGGLDSERARTRSDRPDYFVSGDDPEPAPRNSRPSRSSGFVRPSLSSVGTTPHTPSPARHYAHTPASPSPPYYVQPAQTQQPLSAAGGVYGYPVQTYGGGAGIPGTMWPAPHVPQVAAQPPPVSLHPSAQAERYSGLAQHGGTGGGMGARESPAAQTLPPTTLDGSNSQPGPHTG